MHTGSPETFYPGPASASNSNFPHPVIDPFRDPRFRLWDNVVFHLNNAGYATGCVEKWHLGLANPGFFDTFKAFNSLLRHWVGEPHRSPYRPDIETDEGIRFIETNADRPWFLYQSHDAPHEPLDPPRSGPRSLRTSRTRITTPPSPTWTGTPAESWRRFAAATFWTRLWVIHVRPRPHRDQRPGSSEQGIALPYEEVARVPLIIRYPPRSAEARTGALASARRHWRPPFWKRPIFLLPARLAWP